MTPENTQRHTNDVCNLKTLHLLLVVGSLLTHAAFSHSAHLFVRVVGLRIQFFLQLLLFRLQTTDLPSQFRHLNMTLITSQTYSSKNLEQTEKILLNIPQWQLNLPEH